MVSKRGLGTAKDGEMVCDCIGERGQGAVPGIIGVKESYGSGKILGKHAKCLWAVA